MKIYWIKLKGENGRGIELGITACDWDDATLLLNQAGRTILDRPIEATAVETWKEIQHADELDQNHVVPNMGVLLRRGVWFPNLPEIQ